MNVLRKCFPQLCIVRAQAAPGLSCRWASQRSDIRAKKQKKSLMPKTQSFTKSEAENFMANLNEKQKDIYEMLRAEYDYYYGNWKPVPLTVTQSMWAELIQSVEQGVGVHGRFKTWRWFVIKESHQLKKKAEKEKRPGKEDKMSKEDTRDKNLWYMYVSDQTMAAHHLSQLHQARNFGRQIVFDCSFEDSMGLQELNSLTRQILLSHSFNRSLREPFFFNFTGLNPKQHLWKLIQKLHSGSSGHTFDNYAKLPYDFTHQCFTDIYDPNDIVVLSPNARKPLYDVDPSKVYVIGAITDKATSQPLTLSKAKRHGLECCQLPLHLLQWSDGKRKDLGINVVLEMLHLVESGVSWTETLEKTLPLRCLKRPEDIEQVHEKRKERQQNSYILY